MVDISPGSGTVVADASGRQILRDVYALQALKDKTLQEAKALEKYAQYLNKSAEAYTRYLTKQLPENMKNNNYSDMQDGEARLFYNVVFTDTYGKMSKQEIRHFQDDYRVLQNDIGNLYTMYEHVHNELKTYEYWMLDL